MFIGDRGPSRHCWDCCDKFFLRTYIEKYCHKGTSYIVMKCSSVSLLQYSCKLYCSMIVNKLNQFISIQTSKTLYYNWSALVSKMQIEFHDGPGVNPIKQI